MNPLPLAPDGVRRSEAGLRVTRRTALHALGAGLAGCVFPAVLRGWVEPEAVRVGFIGVGGQGRHALEALHAHAFVAFADVDEERAAAAYRAHPNVPRYRDYRRMLDRHAGQLDAVVISTPDHQHHPMARAALAAGLHVYLEKPLAPTLQECAELRQAAAGSELRTQIGLHGHSFEALRVLREWIDAGAAGPIESVQLWSDRLPPSQAHWTDRPAPEERVPGTLDWDLWLGTRPKRGYSSLYAPSRWRTWWAFGGGALADIATHMFDVIEFALEPGYPERVVAETPGISPETAPPWSRVTWQFPRHGARTGLAVHWTGGLREGRLLKPAEVSRVPRSVVEETPNGMAFVGRDATLFLPDMRASGRPRIYPLERETEFVAHRPARTLERLRGTHYDDWIRSIREGRPAGAPLAYGATVTEKVLLGVLAQRSGLAVGWDPVAQRPTGGPVIDRLWFAPERR